MKKIKSQSKYTLRGKKSLDQSKRENNLIELMTFKRKKIGKIIFEMLINEALIKPVEHFQLPSFLINDNLSENESNSSIKIENNQDSISGKSWGETEDEEEMSKDDWELIENGKSYYQFESNLNYLKSDEEGIRIEDKESEEEIGRFNFDETRLSQNCLKDSKLNQNISSISSQNEKDLEIDNNAFGFLTDLRETKLDFEHVNDFENESFNSVIHSETQENDILSRSSSHSKFFAQLSSIDKSPVRNIYVYPDSYEAETDTIVLIQNGCVSIWIKDIDHGQWNYRYNFLNETGFLIASDVCETEEGFWFTFLFDSKHELIFKIIRFNKFEKCFLSTYLEKFIHEFQFLSKTINLCCLNEAKAALSIPTSLNSVDIFIYNLKLSTKTHLTTLRAKDVSVCSLLPINDSHDLLFGHFNNRIYIWSIDKLSITTMMSTEKSIFENKICFNVLYDKGLVYLFIGNLSLSAIKVVALNPRTCKYASLLKCKISEAKSTVSKKYISLKRRGDQIIVIKEKDLLVFDLLTNRTILRYSHAFIKDISIGFIDDRAVIFAVSDDAKLSFLPVLKFQI